MRFGCKVLTSYTDAEELGSARTNEPWLVIVRPPVEAGRRARCFVALRDLYLKHDIPILALVITPEEEDDVREYLGNIPVLGGRPLKLGDLYDRIQDVLRTMKRSEIRVKAEIVAAHREPGLYQDDFFFYDRLLSLSPGGCFIETRRPYPIGAEVEIMFCIGREAGSVRLVGRVCRHGADADGHVGMGLVFDEVHEKTRARIEAFLFDQLGNLDFPSAL